MKKNEKNKFKHDKNQSARLYCSIVTLISETLPHFGKIEITVILFKIKDDSNQAFCHM